MSGTEAVDHLFSMMETVSKISLQSSRRIQEIVAVVFMTFMVPSNSGMIKKGSEALVNYNHDVKDLGRGHKLGAPRIHLFLAVLRYFISVQMDDTEEASVPQHIKTLKSFLELLAMCHAHEVEQLIAHCKLKPCRPVEGQTQMHLFEICLNPHMAIFTQDLVTTLLQYAEQKEEFQGACAQIKLLPKGNALMIDMIRVIKEEILAIHEAQYLPGVAPKTGLMRALEKQLQQMKDL